MSIRRFSRRSKTRSQELADEAYLRRYRREMKFTYAGPFVRLLEPIEVFPLTDEKYVPDSAERYTIGSRLPRSTRRALARAPLK